eukprot:GHVT01029018.1.p1 GENE.GHVT01029018.1~~GHVT01029018.1.p1  ORF type:complete len:471 (-),score=156.82 GHVT01029018.1:61-1473(-)
MTLTRTQAAKAAGAEPKDTQPAAATAAGDRDGVAAAADQVATAAATDVVAAAAADEVATAAAAAGDVAVAAAAAEVPAGSVKEVGPTPAVCDEAGASGSVSDSTSGWYLAVPPEEEGGAPAVSGPCNLDQLKQLYHAGCIDGLTFACREGLSEWMRLGEIDELRRHLVVLEDEELEEEPPARIPLAQVAPKCMYTTPDGTTMVFDVVDASWRTAQEYEELRVAEGGQPAGDGAEVTVAGGVALSSSSSSSPSSSSSSASSSAAASASGDAAAAGPGTVGEAERILKRVENADKRKQYRQRLKRKRDAGLWIKAKINPNVYVSGLPEDVSFDELCTFFKRAGVLKLDPDTSLPKVRIYKGPDDVPKGDALICFVHEPSAELAVKYFHGAHLRPDVVVAVQRAEFDAPPPPPIGTVTAQAAAHRAQTRKKLRAVQLEQNRLLRWNDDVDDGSGKRIVIMKPLFEFHDAQVCL